MKETFSQPPDKTFAPVSTLSHHIDGDESCRFDWNNVTGLVALDNFNNASIKVQIKIIDGLSHYFSLQLPELINTFN